MLLRDSALHPAVLHAARRTKDLEKCISHGQIRVLFPVIQDLQARVLIHLTKNISDGWIKKFPNMSEMRCVQKLAL